MFSLITLKKNICNFLALKLMILYIMTDEIFERGYKVLLRFFKEIKRYNDFKRITAQYDPQYKQKLKARFKEHKGTSIGAWNRYFDYTFYVGEQYDEYNDTGLDKLRKQWHRFLENYPDLKEQPII